MFFKDLANEKIRKHTYQGNLSCSFKKFNFISL